MDNLGATVALRRSVERSITEGTIRGANIQQIVLKYFWVYTEAALEYKERLPASREGRFVQIYFQNSGEGVETSGFPFPLSPA